MNKYNKLLIILFIIFMFISVFWIYEEKILHNEFEVFYSDDGIPKTDEE